VGIGSELGHQRNWFNIKGEVIGIDIRRNFKPDVLCDAQNLPFKDEVFDVVTASEVLEHLPNALKALQEWWRVLKTHGKLYLTTPNDAWIPVIVHIARRKKMSLHPEHFQSFNYRKLEWLVQYVGFDVLQIDFFTRYLQKGIMPRLAYTFRKLIPSISEANIKLIAVKTHK
jgi:ubiquinone/menaquinone biosynthesis C-methylase UbiE